jgi:hypothetical protein
MLRREDGMTAPELLTALAIAMIISLAAFGLVDVVMAKVGEINGRVEATQRGRAGMDELARQLRSQVCVTRSDPAPMTSPRSVYEAKADSVTFFADLADESYKGGAAVQPVPKLRTLALEGSDVVEKVKDGQVDAANYGFVTYAGAVERKRTLISHVGRYRETTEPAVGTIPVFRYFGFNTATPPKPVRELYPGPSGQLSEADLQALAVIRIKFRAAVPKSKDDRTSSVFINEVYVRTVDPNSNAPKPTCV